MIWLHLLTCFRAWLSWSIDCHFDSFCVCCNLWWAWRYGYGYWKTFTCEKKMGRKKSRLSSYRLYEFGLLLSYIYSAFIALHVHEQHWNFHYQLQQCIFFIIAFNYVELLTYILIFIYFLNNCIAIGKYNKICQLNRNGSFSQLSRK